MKPALLSGPLAQAIGWALLHLVWQGALVAALLALLLQRLSARSASLRYAVSCAALALIVVLGVITAIRSAPSASVATPAPTSSSARVQDVSEPRLSSLVLTAVLRTAPDRLRDYVRTANDALPAVVALWLLGVVFFSARLILDWLRTRRLVNRNTPPARDPWPEAARRLGRALGVRHAVRLLESAAVEVPSVIGFLRPAILLPVSTLTGLTTVQLEMILAHELAHIRRHDFLVNLLQTAVETLLFYHPAVWWISRQVRIERENCCDDLAVAVCGNPLTYARALTRLEELRALRSPLVLSATGGSLFQRVRRLVGGSTRSSGPAVRGASAVAVLSCVLLVLAAQSFSAIGARKTAAEHPHHADIVAAPTPPAGATEPTPAPTQTSPVAEPASQQQVAPDAADDDSDDATLGTDSEASPDPDATPDRPGDSRPTLEELISLRAQNVTPDMIRDMRALFPDIRLMEIAGMTAVGATPEFVRGMRELGLEVRTAGEAQGLAAVGVSPDYVRQMRDAGVELDRAGDAQSLRALGVTPRFVRRLVRAGYPNPTVSQLSRLAAAGVTGDFVREMSKYRSPE